MLSIIVIVVRWVRRLYLQPAAHGTTWWELLDDHVDYLWFDILGRALFWVVGRVMFLVDVLDDLWHDR